MAVDAQSEGTNVATAEEYGRSSSPFDAILPIASTVAAARVARFEEVKGLGLESYVAELEAVGFTVIPPEKVASDAVVGSIRRAVLRVIEERTTIAHALDRNGDRGVYEAALQLDNQFVLFYLVFADLVFEDWLENPVLLALVNYVLRGEGQLSSMLSIVKWRGDGYGPTLGLHADGPSSPGGVLPATHAAACNAALALTDYRRDDGAIAMVPGSHLLNRQPQPGEGVEAAVPVEAAAGSLIFWHGNTWHGAYPKRSDGLRLNLTTFFCHRSLKTQERYGRAVPADMLARHGERFRQIVGADDVNGWDERGPQPRPPKREVNPDGNAPTR